MADVYEQRAAVKFCFFLGKNAGETAVMIKTAYKDRAMCRARVYEWFSRFKGGEMCIYDKSRSGRPSTSRTNGNVELIRALVTEDGRRSIEEIARLSGLSWSSVQRILTEDLGMRRAPSKALPPPTPDQLKSTPSPKHLHHPEHIDDDGGTEKEIKEETLDEDVEQRENFARHEAEMKTEPVDTAVEPHQNAGGPDGHTMIWIKTEPVDKDVDGETEAVVKAETVVGDVEPRENSRGQGIIQFYKWGPPAKKHKGRCYICGRKNDVSTTITCGRCEKFACRNHVKTETVCVVCNCKDEPD